MDNAIKYTPQGGQVRVGVFDESDGPIIEVKDTGPGIPDALQHRIFDRFWRGAPDQSAGAGLGLALAKWAVEANYGELTYERARSGGSLFRISLPKLDPQTATRVASQQPSVVSG